MATFTLQLNYSDVAPVNVGVWKDSGITVVNGQQFTVSATGVGHWDASHTAYPEGSYNDNLTTHNEGDPGLITGGASAPTICSNVRASSLAIAVEPSNPGIPYSSGLQGKRSSQTFTATKNGNIWYGMSDGFYGDNSGSWAITISGIAAVTPPVGRMVRIPADMGVI